jgi:tRNA threonylcarbamoyladenosine biosynthesis protein TsaE
MIRLGSPAATEAFGARLGGALRLGDAVALYGTLGAGKTTLTRGVLRGLGFDGDVSSPTFPIVQVYEPPQTRLSILHVDLYRIENPVELEELGLDEALLDSALIVEWPERLGAALWPHALRLTLEEAEEGRRALTAQVPGAWEDRWPL